MNKATLSMICLLSATQTIAAPTSYHLMDATAYQYLVAATRKQTDHLLKSTASYRSQPADKQVAFITQQLIDTPYIYTGGMGEGDWQPTSSSYQPGAAHIQQNPVYRLDALDCQTFVQYSMAMLYSSNLAEFDQTLLKIAYGAAGNPDGEIVRFYNRNNFVDADFNPVNQQNGYLKDVTTEGDLSVYAKNTTATITRQNWFLQQQKQLPHSVMVLHPESGADMVSRFKSVYRHLSFPKFKQEKVTISYLPKNTLIFADKNGAYSPNSFLFDKIPTPSIAEVVRDVKKWNYHHTNIKELVGSELNISHFGLLYRQQFKQGELIYRQITCQDGSCQVVPVTCAQSVCNELMFAHATDGYPYRYFWYPQTNGDYVCSPNPPSDKKLYTTCNRVERLPLFAYMISYRSGRYAFMNDPSILGLHIEQLAGELPSSSKLSALARLHYLL